MKIYTKTGDQGQTALFAGPRVAKDDARIEAYGTVDELNAFLGMVRSKPLPQDLDQVLERVQNELFAVGAELATSDRSRMTMTPVGESQLAAMEQDIDRWESQLPDLRNFVLPGGVEAAATLHAARTVCRRAERNVVAMQRDCPELANSHVISYLNRVGDLLFVAARCANHAAGSVEPIWRGDLPH